MIPIFPAALIRPRKRPDRWFAGARRVACWLMAGAALDVHAQTHPAPPPVPMFLPDEQRDNVFQAALVLPAGVRRVAVLPLTEDKAPAELSPAAETLGPILLTALTRTKKFEVVPVSPTDLRRETGRSDWSDTELLPASFFDTLQRLYACDAVWFCQLTAFRAYAPLAMGWRMKLIDVHTRQILWAVDELYDAEQPGVLTQARLYHESGLWFARDTASDWRVENSPRLFGQFALARSLSTLPDRKEIVKVSPPKTDVPKVLVRSRSAPPKREELTKVSPPATDEASRRHSDKTPPAKRKPYGN